MGHYKREFENWVQTQLEPEEQNVGYKNRHKKEKSAYWQRVEWERQQDTNKLREFEETQKEIFNHKLNKHHEK